MLQLFKRFPKRDTAPHELEFTKSSFYFVLFVSLLLSLSLHVSHCFVHCFRLSSLS